MQKRFWNWQDDDATFDLSRQNVGLFEAGLYRGFDSTLPVYDPTALGEAGREELGVRNTDQLTTGTMELHLLHDATGARRTLIDRSLSGMFGVIVTKQGVIIQEEDIQTLVLEPTGASSRTDLIICEHEYKEIKGGINATYKVIKGTSSAVPELPNPSIQVLLGIVRLPANCSSLDTAGVSYERSEVPALAGNNIYIKRKGGFLEGNLNANNFKVTNLTAPTRSGDATNKSYVDAKFGSIKPASEIQRGLIEIADQEETNAGVDDFRAITPKKLGNNLLEKTASLQEVYLGVSNNKFITPSTLIKSTATENRVGLAKISTTAEVKEGKRDDSIVTPFKLKQVYRDQVMFDLGKWNLTGMQGYSVDNSAWVNKIAAITGVIYADDGTAHNLDKFGVTVNAFAGNIQVTAKSSEGATSTSVPRGFLLFFIANEIVMPESRLIVNAGPDLYIERMVLSTNAPILEELEIYGEDVMWTVQQPVGYDYSQFVVQHRIKNSGDWITWVNPPNRSGLFNGKEGDGNLYEFRVGAKLIGADFVYGNILEILNTGENVSTYAGPQIPVDTFVSFQGFIEAIGSPVTARKWNITSKPSGSTAELTGDTTLTPKLKVDKFGPYVITLEATNNAGVTASDSLTLNVGEKVNQAPTAVARFNDNTTNKTVTWEVYNTTTGAYNGYYLVWLSSASSTDADGVIMGEIWESSYNNGAWEEFPTYQGIGTEIKKDGNWRFRVRVKDNYGTWSSNSNIITLNITGTAENAVPLNLFQLNNTSGGSGSYFYTGTLTINPIDRINKLAFGLSYFSVNGQEAQPDWTNDIRLEVSTINGKRSSVWGFTASERTVYFEKYQFTEAGENTGAKIKVDLNNVPPTKRAVIEVLALDVQNNVIGRQTFTLGR